MKRVNDTHGHVAGDELLRRVAGCLRLETRHSEGRPSDIVARYGGDEFVLGLRSALFDAAAITERIRARPCEPMQLARHDEAAQLSVSTELGEAPPHAPPPNR